MATLAACGESSAITTKQLLGHHGTHTDSHTDSGEVIQDTDSVKECQDSTWAPGLAAVLPASPAARGKLSGPAIGIVEIVGGATRRNPHSRSTINPISNFHAGHYSLIGHDDAFLFML